MPIVSTDVVPDDCPSCAAPLVTENSTIPWCGDCEWNLDAFEPDDGATIGWPLLDRWSHRTGFRRNARLFTELAGQQPGARRWSVARVVLLAASAALLLAISGLAWLGVVLIRASFPNPVLILVGVLLIALAVLLRPRFGRFTGDYDEMTEQTAPTLFVLVRRVADGIGAPVPHRIVVDGAFNASAAAYGLRQRRVLSVGLPLWAVLDPQERVALVGHELGHFVNGDPVRGLFAQLAWRTFGQLGSVLAPRRGGYSSGGDLEEAAQTLARPLLWLASRVALGVHLALLSVAMRDSQRAEYAADAAAAGVAGSAAVVRLTDDLARLTTIAAAVRTAEVTARSTEGEHAGVARWRAAAERVRTAQATRLPLQRQRSLRLNAHLLTSHPPAGLRARLTETRPAVPATVVLSQEESDRIDAELARRYDRAGRDMIR